MWFVERVSAIENNFLTLNVDDRSLFFQLINSDILAAVEKRSPVVELIEDAGPREFTIYRQEKGFEGEEFLAMLNGACISAASPHIQKLEARKSYLNSNG